MDNYSHGSVRKILRRRCATATSPRRGPATGFEQSCSAQRRFLNCGCLEHRQAVYNDNSGQWTISAAGRPHRPHSFRHHPKTTRDKSRPLSLAICGFLFICKKSTTYLTFDPPTRTLRSLKFFPLLLGNVFSSMAALSNFARKTYNPRHDRQ